MKIKDIISIDVGRYSDRYTLNWKTPTARYHVWLDIDHGPQDNIIHQNAPIHISPEKPGYFSHVALRRDDRCNEPIFNHVLAEAHRLNLFAEADHRKLLAEEQETARSREAARARRIKESGPTLYNACKRVLDSPFEPDKWRQIVIDAIAEAEGR